MSAEFFKVSERLLSATVNGVYQGMLVALLAGLALRWFSRTNAATRYAVWFGVLLFVAALIPAHFFLSLRPFPKIPAAQTFSVAAMNPTLSLAGNGSNLQVADSDSLDPQIFGPDASNEDIASDFPATEQSGERADFETSSTSRTDPPRTNFTPVIFSPSGSNLKNAISLPHSICLCLVCVWVLLAGVRAGLVASRIREVRRIKTTSRAPTEALQTLFDRLRDSLMTRRNVRLRISSAHRSAVVLGFIHPVVLLPEEAGKDANDGEAEHVLRHELAHVDRRDDWGNLAQQMIEAALFFHPAVWWVSGKLSLEREIACDDHVLEASGRPRAYALTLANVASRIHQPRNLLAPGVSNNNSQLQTRINMILNTQRDRSPRLAPRWLGVFTTTTAILAVVALAAGPRLVLAQTPEASPSAAEPASPATPAEPAEPSVPSADVAPAPEPPPPPAALVGVADVAPVTVTPGPTVLIADASPAALPPDSSGPDSAPRPKAGFNYNNNAPAASIASVGPVPPESPAPDLAPVPPTPGARAMKRHLSIEERLDRIERVLESLEAREGMPVRRHNGEGSPSYNGKDQPGMPNGMMMDLNMDLSSKRLAMQAQKAAAEALRAQQDGKLISEQAMIAMMEGQRAMEKAARDFEKENKDFERLPKDLRGPEAESSLKALEALRDARETLQTQLKTLERQIKRLEEDQNRKQRGRSDSSDESPKSEKSAPRSF